MSNTTELSPAIHRIRVAVPVHLYDCFDYQVSAEQYAQAAIGARVSVSFGRQNLVGLITEKLPLDAPIDSRFKLKAITELLDDHAILDEQVLNLVKWSASYYQFPIGEVMHSAIPTLLRQGKPYNLLALNWKIIDPNAQDKLKRSLKQQDAYKILKLHPHGTAETI